MDDARTGKHITIFGRLQERKQWGFDTLVSLGKNDRNFDLYSTLTPFQRLSRTLHPVLVSTFLDCASAVFTPDGKESDTETMMVLAVSRLVSLLYGTILSENEDVSG